MLSVNEMLVKITVTMKISNRKTNSNNKDVKAVQIVNAKTRDILHEILNRRTYKEKY